jgi:hypothetical protein
MKEAIITCLAAWLLLGCAARYAVRIRSISDPALPAGRNYVLRPGDKDVYSDRQFSELAVYVQRTLGELDYREVEVLSSHQTTFIEGHLHPYSLRERVCS